MGSTASPSIESRRQEHQTHLDTLKTAAERNKWGQFATPTELALSIARYVRDVAGLGTIRFLDPAIGTGSFYSALRETFPSDSIETATGIELDSAFAQAAEDLWSKSGLNIVRGDFNSRRAAITLSSRTPLTCDIITCPQTKKTGSRRVLRDFFLPRLAGLPVCIAISSCCRMTGWKTKGLLCGSSLRNLWT